jgi:hypothetical protein
MLQNGTQLGSRRSYGVNSSGNMASSDYRRQISYSG